MHRPATLIRRLFSALLFLHCLIAVPQALYAQSPPRVITDIAPLQWLLSSLLEGITTPHMLIDGTQSPHLFQLKPSQARQVQQADVIIVIGGDLSPELANSIKRLNPSVSPIVLLDLPVDGLLPYEESAHAHAHTGTDPHIWLDPLVMERMMAQVSDILTRRYPDYAEKLAYNRSQLSQSLRELDEKIQAGFAADGLKPSYATYHNAYRYFERRYGLPDSHALVTAPEDVRGTRTMIETLGRINEAGPNCLLTEQEDPLTGRIKTRTIYFDPAYGSAQYRATGYESLLLSLAEAISQCRSAH